MAVLTMGLVLSYSGSGLLCLGVALLFPLGRGTVARVVTALVLGAGIFLVLDETLNISYTVNRVNEFTSTGSSAYCRFIHPAASAVEQLNTNPWTSLLGHGPGSITRMRATCPSGFETALAKSLFEYGLLGAAAFGVFIFNALRRAAAPARLRAAGAVTWLLLTGLLAAETLLFIYIVSAMWPDGIARKPA
jgi:hypothetical protein